MLDQCCSSGEKSPLNSCKMLKKSSLLNSIPMVLENLCESNFELCCQKYRQKHQCGLGKTEAKNTGKCDTVNESETFKVIWCLMQKLILLNCFDFSYAAWVAMLEKKLQLRTENVHMITKTQLQEKLSVNVVKIFNTALRNLSHTKDQTTTQTKGLKVHSMKRKMRRETKKMIEGLKIRFVP